MTRWIRLMLGVALGFAAFGTHAQTCTVTINPGATLQTTLQNAAIDSVICLNPGTYTGESVLFPANGGFAIGKRLIVKGLGATPAGVVLQSTNANVDHTVYFVNYLGGGSNASQAQMINLTIQGGRGGVQIYNFPDAGATRLTDIKLKDLVISTVGVNGFGVKTDKADRIVLDNVTVGSHLTAFNLINTTDSLVMNSTATHTVTEAAVALSVLGGSGNRFVNNTFGNSPRTTTADPYSFNGGGVVFYNTSYNRFEGNLVQGMRDDAVDFTITDLSVNGIGLQKSLHNYVGRNTIVHSDFNLHNEVLGSAGVWSNCASDGTWIYGNEIRNVAECAVCAWGSKSNMILGNNLHNSGIVGLSVSGGQEAINECVPAGNTGFQQKPTDIYVQSNASYYNKNDQMVVRNADGTVITRNFLLPTDGLNGPPQGCLNQNCQAAFSIETDGSMFGSNTGTKILGNTTVGNLRGLWATTAAVTNIDFAVNRIIGTNINVWVTGSTQNIDRGSVLGGNHWGTAHFPTGNPSQANPYSGVFHNMSSNTGNVVDRYPFQHEELGRGYNILVHEPRAGTSVARGTRRTVRWNSIGCFWVDLTLNGTALVQNAPNTGYAMVDIPANATLGNFAIVATCKDRTGTARGSANSPTFAITSDTLKLVSPGRDDTFTGGTQIWVSWKNSAPGTNTTVFVEYSSDGGTTWPTLLATVNNQNTSNAHVSSTRVTLPAAATAYGMMRVRSSATVVDNTDGVFAVRGGTGALTNVSAPRIFRMGEPERLEWSSPANSRLVDITANSGGGPVTVASNLPDRGHFDWVVPLMLTSPLSITVNFKTETGAAISNTTNAASGVIRGATTITFGATPGIGPGQSAALSATSNSGAAVTLTSATPGTCSVTGGNTINGLANGTCTINANAPANGGYAVALQSQLTFSIGQTQTITFSAPEYLVVGTSLTLSATASSGGPVTFSSLTPTICTVGGNTVTGNLVGNCTVAANQPGFGGFGAAAQVTDTLQSVAGGNLPRLVNIATRMSVQTGDNVLIGGFVLGGNTPKSIVVRARGPSLTAAGVPGALANPVLQLFSGPTMIDSNDNWQSHPNQANLQAAGFQPSEALEAAIYTTIGPGAFSAIVSGLGGGTGVGIIEVFEVPGGEDRRLINISTRGQVLTGADVMIAGFVIQGQAPQTVVVRARGPSLAGAGIVGFLANPRLQLFTGGTEIGNNDNWQTAANAGAIQASGFAPLDPAEPAIMVTLNPGAYSAIISGVGNTTGVAIVEVFGLEQ